MKIYRDSTGKLKLGTDPNRVITISSSEDEGENSSNESDVIEISSDETDEENLDIPNQGLSGQSNSEDESMDGDDVPLDILAGPSNSDRTKSDEKLGEPRDTVTPGAVSDVDLDNVRFWPSGSSSDSQSDCDSDDEFVNPLVPGEFVLFY